jgi:hypothetical protein
VLNSDRESLIFLAGTGERLLHTEVELNREGGKKAWANACMVLKANWLHGFFGQRARLVLMRGNLVYLVSNLTSPNFFWYPCFIQNAG